MEQDIDHTSVHVPLVDGQVNMQIVDGQVFTNTIQVTDGSGITIAFNSTQPTYSTPLATNQFIIQHPSSGNNIQYIKNSNSLDQYTEITNDDSDTDVNDKVMSGHYQRLKEDIPSDDLIFDHMTQSISHHDYIGSVPQIQRPDNMSLQSSQVPSTSFGTPQDSGLVIEEAVAEEIVTSQTTLDDEEIVRSKPLTAMYLQRKEIGIGDNIYGQTHHKKRTYPLSPTKSPGSSKFTLKPSSRNMDFGYEELNAYPFEDDGRLRLNYNDPISVYHPNTGEIHFKVEPDSESELKKPGPQRSVGAILAASEVIKHQDIASEVEVGTYEVEVNNLSKHGRKRKEKKSGIDDDIEQIRKAAKNVAYTLKGMKDEQKSKRRKKPRIRLTLTKSKSPRVSSYYEEDDSEYEMPPTTAQSRRGRKGTSNYDKNSDIPSIVYQCEYCEKQFKSRDKVRIHTKIHTEERAFTCDICDARYRRREHLVRHYRAHTNERPYQCLECGKSYMRAEHLKRHSYDHTGEKPFECPICPKAFIRHDRLIKHSLVHDK